ncbi:MAG TPA: hypothetical protein VF310_11680 [Vicinamibacteria bacterium]
MLGSALIAALVVVSCVVVLWLDGRRREKALMRDWEMLLTPKAQQRLNGLQRQVEFDLGLADLLYTQAEDARASGDHAAALRLLDAGCRLIEAYCPSAMRSLAAMNVLSRMVVAIAPVRPLRPRDYQVGELNRLAYLGRFLHHLLVTTAERFRLRVQVLSRGFAVVMRLLLRSRSHATANGAATDRDWAELQALRHDVRVLTNESLESFRVLLISMTGARRIG